jgi:hypothetical protein
MFWERMIWQDPTCSPRPGKRMKNKPKRVMIFCTDMLCFLLVEEFGLIHSGPFYLLQSVKSGDSALISAEIRKYINDINGKYPCF